MLSSWGWAPSAALLCFLLLHLLFLLWFQAKPLLMHLHSTWCLITEGVPGWGSLQKTKSQERWGKILVPPFFTVCSLFIVSMAWWNWPDSLLPCMLLSLWLWKRNTKRALASTGFCCRQMCCSRRSDICLPLVDTLARISYYFLESGRVLLPLRSLGPLNLRVQPCFHLRLGKGWEGKAAALGMKALCNCKLADSSRWKCAKRQKNIRL